MDPGLLVRQYLSTRGKACHANTPDKDPEGDDDKESPIKQLIRLEYYGPLFRTDLNCNKVQTQPLSASGQWI